MRLSELNIYPIKSLKGISLADSVVEDRGLRFDRRWMLVDREGEFLTQRELPIMATLATALTGGGLVVTGANASIKIPAEPDKGEHINVTVWNSRVRALAYEGEVSEWFSDALGTACRLVLMPERSRRPVNSIYAVRPGEDIVSFADGYPFMLIGQGSFDDINSKLEEPVPMNRFRPNFVASDTEPFDEDNWRKIRIGETVFHVVKPSARCVITTVDQATGIKGHEPLKTLSGYRKLNGNVLFGQNLIAEKSGAAIAVGDEIEVLERR